MKTRLNSTLGLASLATALICDLSAATLYVALDSPNPSPPYRTWATAARVIQNAVDVAAAGDEIVVTNGTYATGGGRAVLPTGSNRVAITKPLTLRSVNGPQYTLIQGAKAPGGGTGNGAIRCVYLTEGTSLSGFTLTNGATEAVSGSFIGRGGGAACTTANALLTNCVLTHNSAQSGGGVHFGTLYNCVLTSNSARSDGGGAYQAALYNSTLSGNSAERAGGACWGTLNNCTLTGNSAQGSGGGAYSATLSDCVLTANWARDGAGGGSSGGTLNDCTLTDNRARDGGGASGGTLNNCALANNRAENGGGGASDATLNNCVLTLNSARSGGGVARGTLNNCVLTRNTALSGGGILEGTLNNCTLTGNSADHGGGALDCTLNNCVACFNTAHRRGPNHSGGSLNYCCTTPLPTEGVGNIGLDPQLASASHLSASSPCRGAGSALYPTGTDIDGGPWATPPSIGCDEYHAGELTGPLTVSILAAYTNVAVGYPVDLTALIEGRTTASVWDFGDGLTATNQPYTSHAWTAPGDYTVVLRAYNESHPEGLTATATVHVVEAAHYVAADSANPVPPYASWATAATTIQEAVDVGVVPGALILVTNGTYATGGRAVVGTMTNRVVVDKPLRLLSVNGPEFTLIQGHRVPDTTNGDGAIRCVYLTNGASLSGFTLTNGATRTEGDGERQQSGGAVWCASTSAALTNCVLAGSSASWSGGGVYGGRLDNCTITGNSAGSGGGASESVLNNCIVSTNWAASVGGGASGGTLSNCTLAGNSAAGAGGGACGGTLYDCTLNGNSAGSGGGAHGSAVYDCRFTDNRAGQDGGGTCESTLHDCTLTGNSAGDRGGGAADSTLCNCTLTGNSASGGGGAAGGTLNNCVLSGNSAARGGRVGGFCRPIDGGCGGGVFDATLWNCTLTSNQAAGVGGGAAASTLYNCTLTGNSADQGGGVSGVYVHQACNLSGHWLVSTLRNCIVRFNTGGDYLRCDWDYPVCDFEYSCAEPLPPGPGNIDADPQMVTVSHLSTASPCVHAGSPAYASGVDIDGEPWADPPAMGADQPGATAGPLSVRIEADLTQVGVGYPVTFQAWNTGPILQSVWDFGDGTVLTNRPAASHVWSAPGVYLVKLTGYNESQPGGVTTNVAVTVTEATSYANAASANPVFPYSSWDTAATSIQEAIGASTVPGRVLLVTNGVYSAGTVETNGQNRVALTNPVIVRSVNGPQVTVIQGATGVRCAYVGNASVLSGFTLTNGDASSGGGAMCGRHAVVTNCILTGNSGCGASGGTLYNCTVTGNLGCGASGGTLYNCTVTGNSEWGAYECTLYNCTLTGNLGAGATGGTLYNCTVTGNSGGGTDGSSRFNCIVCFNGNWNWFYGDFVSCCTTPLPEGGVGNIEADPRFVNAAAGDFRLQSNSPCINAGNNAYAPGSTDLDGNPRIVSGTVDMGAYEYQGAGSVISYAYLQRYGLPTDGSADTADTDADGLNTWQEWRCQTDPTSALSVLRLLSATPTGTDVLVNWPGVAGVSYFLERSTDLGATPRFTPLATNVIGSDGTNTFTDLNAAAWPSVLYRVGVGE